MRQHVHEGVSIDDHDLAMISVFSSLFSEALLLWLRHGPSLPKRYSKAMAGLWRDYGGARPGAKLVRSSDTALYKLGRPERIR